MSRLTPMFACGLSILLVSIAWAQPTAPADETPRVTGRVIDVTGDPVAGVHVESLPDELHLTTTSAPDGGFVLELPKKPRVLMLLAVADDGTRQACLTFSDLKGYGKLPSYVKLVLRPAREVKVTVVDNQQRPVSGASVAVSAWSFPLAKTATDDSGEVLLRVPADAPLDCVMASKPHVGLDYFFYRGAGQPKTNLYELAPDHSEPLTMVLNGVHAVTVQVVDPEGRPMEGVLVSPKFFVKPEKGSRFFGAGMRELQASTNAQGKVVFDCVPADNATIVGFWITAPAGYFSPHRAVFDPQSPESEVTETLERLTTVHGRVLFADGQPAAGADVKAAGDGYLAPKFEGSVRAAADGQFEIAVYPNQFYIFTASLDNWVSPLVARVVRADEPADELLLPLVRATRVFGRLTAGPNHRPLAGEHVGFYRHVDDEQYRRFPPAEQLPGPADGHIIRPIIGWSVRTGEEGEFEFVAGPGKGYLIVQQNVPPPQFEVTDQTELELNLHAEHRDPVELSGRVVLRDEPEEGVADAIISSLSEQVRSRPVNTVSDVEGNFHAQRSPHEMLVLARTEDHSLAGIIRIQPDDESCVIPVAETASVRGRIISSATGKPLSNRQIDFGLQRDAPSHGLEFGGTVTTDAQGEFFIEGLVPGWEFRLQAVSGPGAILPGMGRPGRPARIVIGSVKPERAETIDLGDVKLDERLGGPAPGGRQRRAFGR